MTGRARVAWLLGALAVAAALYFATRPSATEVGVATPASPGGTQESGTGSAVGDIRLESLEARRDERLTLDRNVFRFEARRSAATARAAGGAPRAARAAVPTGPPPPALPPPPPPIPLRYIGYVDQPGEVPRVAVLSDGRGNVFNGKEGDIIEGRYRVLRIGTDSADLIYVDGRGRQTIRLSGQ